MHHRADSIYRSGQEQVVLDIEAKYENEKKQSEIDQLNYEKQLVQLQLGRRNRVLLFGGIMLILAGIFSILLYRLLKRTKASEKELSTVNKSLKNSLDNNKTLLKEIHHRVKNNLQVVSSLLTLQSKFVEDKNALDAINTGKSRVQSMSILHRNLYQNENLKNIKIKPYFEDLIENLVNTYKIHNEEIEISCNIDDIELDVDTVIPLGLVTNELITNAMKYAFQGKKHGRINLDIALQNDYLLLSVSDNGIGISFQEIPKRSSTLGMQLIRSFGNKLNADIEINNEKGTQINLYVPIPSNKTITTKAV